MTQRKWFLAGRLKASAAAVLTALGVTCVQAASLSDNSDLQAKLQELSSYAKVSVQDLQTALSQATYQPVIIKTMTRPYESKEWWEYRKLFITTSRIQAGVQFWLANESVLQRAADTYGVPPEIVCAIIGVETFYGRNQGTWSVLDALYTLGFNYPPRQAYFSKEFANFVHLARQENWELRSVKGSYAGAMGMGQFMPGSYLNYAVDFDGDGHINLFTDVDDAIGSVAHYFKAHGWQKGRGIFYPALAEGDMSPVMQQEWELTGQKLYEAGVSTKVVLQPEEKLRLFAYKLADGRTSYGVGLENFHTIMRYNKSPLYARAVYELSEFIRLEHNKVRAQQGESVNPQGRVP